VGGDLVISRVCYATREDVKAALDFKESARNNSQIDRALQSSAEKIEGFTHRKFFPKLATRVFDWPNYQRSYPWRLWLNQNEVISVTTLSSGGVVIPSNQYFLEPANDGPPYTHIDLDRSTSAAWSSGATPQHSISIAGLWGFNADTAAAGALASAMTDTTGTVATITDSSLVGTGDTILIDSERMLVTARSMVTTGQTQQSGASTVSQADVALTVTDGTKYAVGEILLLDSERMLIVDIAANVLTVKRSWDGTVLATHSGATVFAPRQLTVVRGTLGTTAATHLISAPVARQAYPSLIRDLAIAESVNQVLQETSGYALVVGEGDTVRPASGAGLAELWAEVVARYGRNTRSRVI
jgi:hypothetical protein